MKIIQPPLVKMEVEEEARYSFIQQAFSDGNISNSIQRDGKACLSAGNVKMGARVHSCRNLTLLR